MYVKGTVRRKINDRFHFRGFFTRAHAGISSRIYFCRMRLVCTEKVKKLRFKKSLGNDPKKIQNRTWTGTQTGAAGAGLEFVREVGRGLYHNFCCT